MLACNYNMTFWCVQAALCQEWVRFEREHGSAEEQLAAELKVEPILEAAAAAAITAADGQGAAAAQVSTGWGFDALSAFVPCRQVLCQWPSALRRFWSCRSDVLHVRDFVLLRQSHQLVRVVWDFQAAAEKAPKLSKEEMRRLRQERDPNFAKAKGKGKADTDADAMPPPARRLPPKRKKGLGYEVLVLRSLLLL